MRSLRKVSVLAVLLVVGFAVSSVAQTPKGHLVIIGGGTIPDDLRVRVLELSGGPKANVVVMPQASELPETGPETVALWKKFGAANAQVIQPTDVAAATSAINDASLIWFPGGDQTKLAKAWAGTGVPELIRRRYEQGATVAGTSAGAAIMSKVMITGDGMDLQAITSKKTDVAEGFGLWPTVIVDQHFLKRQRTNRLVSAVLDHPELVGIGIDESTAVVVQGSRFEVLGKSAVVVVDARKAKVTATPAGETITGQGLTMHVLKAGQALHLGR
jgi:cyanophycinase